MSKKENYFILETFDEEINTSVQFHYWTSEKRLLLLKYRIDNGTTVRRHNGNIPLYG